MLSYDFEKPILALEEKIRKFRDNAVKDHKDNTQDEQEEMKKELEDLKKSIYGNLNAWQKIQISRHPDRPRTLDYIKNIFSDFVELHGDRNIRDDKSMVGGFAMLNNKTVMVIGQEKGKTTREKQYRNFGMNSPEGYKKASRLMKLAEKFNKPVICIVDTPGASPGLEAEKHGQAEAIAKNIRELLLLKVPVISVIIGEGSSAGALSMSVADRVLMMEFTWFSVISPESCSSILWHDWNHKEQAAEALRLTADDLYNNGMINTIIREPLGGAHYAPQECYPVVKNQLLFQLDELEKMNADERTKARLQKFISRGFFEEIKVPPTT